MEGGTGTYQRILIASPVFLDPGWLPTAADCEELADLREEHERLVEAVRKARSRIAAERKKIESTEVSKHEALRRAIANGENPSQVKLPTADTAAFNEALGIHEAACTVLEEFIVSAQEQINERAPKIRDSTDLFFRKAMERRIEARGLLAEADLLEARPKKLSNWLDRYTGESHLGPISFDALDPPVRQRSPELFDEIAGLPPATVIGIGDDEAPMDFELEEV
jgi:hypothetical protein